MAYIECRDLTLGFSREEILQKVSFEVEKGDYLCIVGENGAGKTTLIKTLLGLIDPIGGEIVFNDGLKRTDIGYLPQQTDVQKDFPASVREVVMSGFSSRMGYRFRYTQEQKETAARIMERLEITDLAGRSFRKLSGGQAQRVLLARALCAADKVLLLDEPAAGLDPVATGRLYRIIKELNRDGMAIIMVSHDLDEAARYAAHVLHLGKHSFYGTAKEYFGSKTGAEFAAGQRINEINRQVILDQTKPGKPVMPIRPKKQKRQTGTEQKNEGNS